MSLARVLGVIILVVGLILLGFGVNSSQVFTEKVVEGVSGRYTEKTMFYLFSGIILGILGYFLAFRRRKK